LASPTAAAFSWGVLGIGPDGSRGKGVGKPAGRSQEIGRKTLALAASSMMRKIESKG